MKIALLYCSYGVPELVDKSLTPWINAKEKYPIDIFAVSCQFKEYFLMGTQQDLDTHIKLNDYKSSLKYLYSPDPSTVEYSDLEQEHKVRDRALQEILKGDYDYVILWDGDEVISDIEIDELVSYIERNSLINWFRIEYRNLTFTDQTYTKGFSPPRIFKVKAGNYRLLRFRWDNDCAYINIFTSQEVDYTSLASVTVPTKICNPLHYSWISCERSKNKIRYQEQHFGLGSGCSYKWDEEKDCLVFNLDFYHRTGQEPPKLYPVDE